MTIVKVLIATISLAAAVWIAAPIIGRVDRSAGQPAPNVAARGEVTMVFRYAQAAGDLPESLPLVILFTRDGTGVLSIPGPGFGRARPATAAVKWSDASSELVVAPHTINLGTGSTLRLDAFRVRLDAGAIDRGSGSAAGFISILMGDVYSSGQFEASLTLAPDRVAPTAAIEPLWSGPNERVLPGEPLAVSFSEPVDAEAARAGIRLLAGGAAQAARLDIPTPMHGLIDRAVLVPTAAAVSGADLTLEIGAIADPSGNRLASKAAPIQTLPDAGDALANPGFERGLDHWTATGEVAAAGAIGGAAPAGGLRQAVLKSTARLVGAFDLPAAATTLSFSAAAVSEGAGFDAQQSAVVWLVADGGRWPMFDAGTLAPRSPTIAPMSVSFDLTRWRGRRVLIVAETRGSGYFGFNYHTLLVDEFSVR